MAAGGRLGASVHDDDDDNDAHYVLAEHSIGTDFHVEMSGSLVDATARLADR